MITVEPISAFSDNYIWCMFDQESRMAVVVDPGDAQPVKHFLTANNLELTAILVTHHHMDHTGGIKTLLELKNVPVYGPVNPQIAETTTSLKDSDTISVLGLEFSVITIPGHTLDHIAFYSNQHPDGPLVFCGDTLFAGGCGRVFEGDPAMMLGSLNKLATLPAQTKCYCAHEYTLGNLTFAIAVEPNNPELKARINSAKALREKGLPTVPSRLELELLTNPFLRCDTPGVITQAQRHSGTFCTQPEQVFGEIRGWKDNF